MRELPPAGVSDLVDDNGEGGNSDSGDEVNAKTQSVDIVWLSFSSHDVQNVRQ